MFSLERAGGPRRQSAAAGPGAWGAERTRARPPAVPSALPSSSAGSPWLEGSLTADVPSPRLLLAACETLIP